MRLQMWEAWNFGCSPQRTHCQTRSYFHQVGFGGPKPSKRGTSWPCKHEPIKNPRLGNCTPIPWPLESPWITSTGQTKIQHRTRQKCIACWMAMEPCHQWTRFPANGYTQKKEVSRLLIKEDNCEFETGDHPLTTACVISSVFSAFRSMYL